MSTDSTNGSVVNIRPLESVLPHLCPVGRCTPPVGWMRLVPRLPRWVDQKVAPCRVPLSVSLARRMDTVQREVQSKLKYRTDFQQHGVEDRWEVPGLTSKSGVGDCEDFAFDKAYQLIQRGVDRGCLRLALCYAPVQTISGEREEAHAVLAVNTNKGTMILDNRYPLPLSDDRMENVGVYACRRLPYRWVAWSVPGQWFWWESIK